VVSDLYLVQPFLQNRLAHDHHDCLRDTYYAATPNNAGAYNSQRESMIWLEWQSIHGPGKENPITPVSGVIQLLRCPIGSIRQVKVRPLENGVANARIDGWFGNCEDIREVDPREKGS
jgi:hypothetical protein